MTIYRGKEVVDSEILLCKGKADLPRKFTHSTRAGHSIFNEDYLRVKSYLFDKISKFNSLISKEINFTRVESSQMMDPASPLVDYYVKKFPTRQFRTTRGDILRPAACTTALNLFGKVPINTIIHEMATCFRVENSGECKGLKRCTRFVMPDYHGHFEPKMVGSAFGSIVNNLKLLYSQLGIDEDLVQIYRYTSKERGNPYLSDSRLPSISQDAPWQEIDESEPRPYFKIKYEINYCGGRLPVQLGTIQIDEDLPKMYGLPGVVIHFSMGSIERLIHTIDQVEALPANYLKLVVLDHPCDQFVSKVVDVLKCYPLRTIRLSGQSQLIKAIRVKQKSEDLRECPLILLLGSKEASMNKITIIDRRDHSQKIATLEELGPILDSIRYWCRTP